MTTTKEIQNTVTTKQRVGIISPLQADRSANTWHKIQFNPPFPDNNQVIVIPMTQTYQGTDTPGLRIRNVNPQGFEIRFDEIITSTGNNSNGQHANEQDRALIKNTDDFLGVLALPDARYSVRQRSPYKESFDTSSLKRKSSFVKIAQQWGIILATAHSRADKDFNPIYIPYSFAKQVTKQTENSQEEFQLLVKEIAFDYAQQVERDWQSFLNHFDVEPMFCD